MKGNYKLSSLSTRYSINFVEVFRRSDQLKFIVAYTYYICMYLCTYVHTYVYAYGIYCCFLKNLACYDKQDN